MRKYLLLFIYNFCLVAVVFYIFFIANKEVKLLSLPSVKGLTEEEGITLLKDYEVAIKYVESDIAKDTILYTEPNANQLVFEKQLIILYVSKGYAPKYRNLKNQIYEDCKSYLSELKEEYNLDITVKYVEIGEYPDGLIYEMRTEHDYISPNEKVEITVISNPKTVVLPDFIGWTYQDVLKFARDNKINVEFEYVSFLFEANCVVGQSVLAGELVFKQSNPVIIYLAKEN